MVGSDHLFLIGRRISQEETERSKQDVYNANDGHEPGEADAPCDRSACGWTYTTDMSVNTFL